MEKRMKKQKRKLIVRVSVIVFAVWLLLSAAYSVLCYYSGKDVARQQLYNMAEIDLYNIQMSSSAGTPPEQLNNMLNINRNFYDDSVRSQVKISERMTGKTIADTCGKFSVIYGIKTGVESRSTEEGYLDYAHLRELLGETRFNTIADYLNTDRDDGYCYELLCTKFYLTEAYEIVPAEVQVVLTEQEHKWIFEDDVIETFVLNPKLTEKNAFVFSAGNETVHALVETDEKPMLLEYDDMQRNVIPTDFLMHDVKQDDIIGSLPQNQLADGDEYLGQALFEHGLFDAVFYRSDILPYTVHSIREGDLTDESISVYESNAVTYVFQYAQRFNPFDYYKLPLFFGVSVLFVFFLIIAVILIVMMWKLMKNQMVQEQRRMQLSNALAHDIKTPLFVISGYAENLRENINNEKRDYFAEKIIAQTAEVNAMVHKILDLGRLDAFEGKPQRSEWDLYALAQEVCGAFADLPDGKDIVFTHEGSNIVCADRKLMKRALENLVDNAVKYSPENSEITVAVNGKSLSISNPCEGLEKDDIKRLWQPYERKESNHRQDGSGLGLSIVKSICDLHGFSCGARLKEDIITFTVEC